MDEIIEYSQNLTLLYVEDNDTTRETTILILEELFDNIITAVNGQDGLDKYSENQKSIDLIITDINMPIMNGIEMTRKIKEINPDIPVLVLSAYNEAEYFMDSIKLGVEGYILKPVDIDQFLMLIKKTTKKINIEYESKKNLQLLNQYQEAINASSIISKTDPKGVITYVNQAFCDISEYSCDELIGQPHNFIRHPDMPAAAFKDMWNSIKNKKETWHGIVRNRTKYGKSYYVKTTIKPILDNENSVLEYIAIRDDITDIMNPKRQLDDSVKNAKDPIITYMKLENFETIVEFYDNEIVERIQDKVRVYLEENLPLSCNFEKVYQIGNGEYAMVCEKSLFNENAEEFISLLKEYQQLIKEGIINIGELDYDVSVLMSLAYESQKVLESAKLGIAHLLRTKQEFIISNNFAQKEQESAEKNMKTIKMVKKAIEDSKIVSHFQPIVNNKTQKIDKYESLVRLVNEEGKILSPFFFLDVSKKGKYYSQITEIVLKNSFDALKQTSANISINLSALDIEQKSTRKKIFQLLDENRENTHRVVLELLEDESVKDFKTIERFITKTKEYGVKIAIDDFGAGYSNFERLLDYQPDILKIDGCLVRDIETNSYSLSVVKTIVAFAKEQNIETVAEFVENEQIFNILKNLGVDYSQGYYFGKPEEL